MIVPERKTNLTENDYKMLAASFISREIALAAALFRVGDIEGAELIGRKPKASLDFAGVVFSYCQPPDYSKVVEYDLRLDTPHLDGIGADQTQRKYLKSFGSRGAIYFVPGITAEMLQDTSTPIYICEGAKKALSLLRVATDGLAEGEKWRFIPIALSGVWNFAGTVGKALKPNGGTTALKGLITDFQLLNLTHRQVVVVFDNDTHTNYLVKLARYRLGDVLQREKQAIVYFVDLPKYDEKRGIDDLLGEWEHVGGEKHAVEKCLKLFDKKFLFNNTIQTVLTSGKTLNVAADERGKFKVILKDKNGETLAVDVFKPAEMKKRNDFIKQIKTALDDLTEAEETEISRELVKLATVSDVLTESAKDPVEASGETIETSFQILKDGRVIEQIRGGFAVYDAETSEHSILETVTDSDGITYAPIDDALFSEGGLHIADDLTEYGTENELDAEIEKYLSTYLDLKPLPLKLAAKYIRFTFVYDKVLELSYINATGDAGSGKSRFGLALALASRRGLVLITPSAASVFRIVDMFKPTLFLDEFNSADSDDAAAIIQILNSGFQRTGKIPRQLGTGDGKFKTELFDPYCPKIIGSLKQSKSGAFNSRCVQIEMERTTRNDIPLSLSFQMLKDAQALQNKLTLYRLRNYQKDFEARRKIAETELKQAGIVARSIQVNTPLFALIESRETKDEFINLLKGRDEVLAEEKGLSLDGEIVDKIHTLLFETYDDETIINPTNFSELPAQNEVCEELRLERLLGMINAKRSKEIAPQSFGKMVIGLGLRTKKILKRASAHRTQKAIIFDVERLGYLFKIYNLPVSPEFDVTNVTNTANLNNSNNLSAVTLAETGGMQEKVCYQPNPSSFNNYNNGNNGNNGIAVKAETKTTVEIDEVF